MNSGEAIIIDEAKDIAPEMVDALEDQRVFEQALQPGAEYVDATAMMKAMARRIKRQDAAIARMENVLERLAGVLEPLAKRSVEHTADINLLKLGKRREREIILGKSN